MFSYKEPHFCSKALSSKAWVLALRNIARLKGARNTKANRTKANIDEKISVELMKLGYIEYVQMKNITSRVLIKAEITIMR